MTAYQIRPVCWDRASDLLLRTRWDLQVAELT